MWNSSLLSIKMHENIIHYWVTASHRNPPDKLFLLLRPRKMCVSEELVVCVFLPENHTILSQFSSLPQSLGSSHCKLNKLRFPTIRSFQMQFSLCLCCIFLLTSYGYGLQSQSGLSISLQVFIQDIVRKRNTDIYFRSIFLFGSQTHRSHGIFKTENSSKGHLHFTRSHRHTPPYNVSWEESLNVVELHNKIRSRAGRRRAGSGILCSLLRKNFLSQEKE